MKRVIVESPYAGDVKRNLAYARACVSNCLHRGESPIASHLLYTQPGILRDEVKGERELGIRAGLAWLAVADYSVYYTDCGWSRGMLAALHDFSLRTPHDFRIRSLRGVARLPEALHEEAEDFLRSKIEL